MDDLLLQTLKELRDSINGMSDKIDKLDSKFVSKDTCELKCQSGSEIDVKKITIICSTISSAIATIASIIIKFV